ncbi:MAG: transglycosylase domain-containing protein [Marinicellaceae bacterium]
MPRKKQKKQKNKKFLIVRFLLWFSSGLIIGLFVPWYFYLQSILNNLFIDYNWSVPSSIYARALDFYESKNISSKEIDYELLVLGYKKTSNPRFIGEFSKSNNTYEIHSKGFAFLDGNERPKVIKFSVQNNTIKNLNQDLARLEPLLIGRYYNKDLENRQPISLSNIPNTMVMGLQAVEDRNFNQHLGIDIFGIGRAAIKNLFAGKIVQGGSTITQQLVKNRLQYKAKSWIRKANEALSAILLEQKLEKGEILESYFNEIYWGQKGSVAIHGVSQAAQYYFSKKPAQLNIAEQALLIGMVKGPSWYHPINQQKRALNRRNTVLNAWYETSIISETQWKNAKTSPIDVRINDAFANQQFKDFIGLVNLQLSLKFSKSQLNQEGMKVFTTLNPFIQYQLLNTLQWHTNKLGQDLQSAAVVSDAITGEIMAIKGSKEKFSFYNRAIISKRQIGSLIKPFLYLAALEKIPNFTLNNVINDAPLKIKTKSGEYWQPKNWDNKSQGRITARKALIHSRNQATVSLGLELGVSKFVKYLKSIGLNINRSNHPSVFLGATELTPLEVTNLFLILSSNANQQHLKGIKHIVDSDNQLLGTIKRENNLQISQQSISQIKSAMSETTIQGTANKLTNQFGFKNLFGKTGTTNGGKNSWFAGFDQKYLAVFWVGKDDNTPTQLSGSSGALVLWANWYDKVN